MHTTLRPDFVPNLNIPRHRWFHFKEGYSSTLVSSMLHDIKRSPGSLLDPFLGSGTSALEAAHWGWSTVGIEVNPFIAFVAKIKTEQSYCNKKIRSLYKESLKGKVNGVTFKLPKTTTLVEKKGLSKWLFNRSVANEYERIRAGIDKLDDKKYSDLFLLALIGAMSQVSNGRRDGKCWRYRKNWQLKGFDASDLFKAYKEKVEHFAKDTEAIASLSGKTQIILGDSRRMDDYLSDEKQFDGLITSPPYPNSFDYTDIYRPEMLLLGVAKTPEDLKPFRMNSLRSHIQINWPNPKLSDIDEVKSVVEAVKEKTLWDKKLGDMINAYFVDIENVVQASVKRIKPGGKMAWVVANSAYGGIVIPVDVILEKILKKYGVVNINETVLRKTPGNGNHQQKSQEELKEFILVGQVQ